MLAVRDAVPAGLGGELDRLPSALRLRIDEPVPAVVEGDVELSLLDALVKPGATKDQSSQPVHQRTLRGPDQLRPAIVDVLAEWRSRIGHFAVDDKAHEVLGPVILDWPPQETDLARRLLASFTEISLIEGEAQLPIFKDEVLSGAVVPTPVHEASGSYVRFLPRRAAERDVASPSGGVLPNSLAA